MLVYIYIYNAEKLSVCLSAFFLCDTTDLTTKAHIDTGLTKLSAHHLATPSLLLQIATCFYLLST